MVSRSLLSCTILLAVAGAALAGPTKVPSKAALPPITKTVTLQHLLPSQAAQLLGGEKAKPGTKAVPVANAVKLDARDSTHTLILTGPQKAVTDAVEAIRSIDAVQEKPVRFLVRLLRVPVTGDDKKTSTPEEILAAETIQPLSGQIASLTLAPSTLQSGYAIRLSGRSHKVVPSATFAVRIDATNPRMTTFEHLGFQTRSAVGTPSRTTLYIEPNDSAGPRYEHVLEITPLPVAL